MKLTFSRVFLICGFGALLGIQQLANAQNDNPTGKSGVFNGNSHTAGSYDPYTANATRTVVDLVVPGSQGAYALQWTRTMNTRHMEGPNYDFGSAASWQHAYNWGIDWTVGVTPEFPGNKIAPARPESYIVYYPDGRVVEFEQRPNSTDPVYRGPTGVTDRFQSLVGTGSCYLLLSDGGKVEFWQIASFYTPTREWSFQITPRAVIDPYGLRTQIVFDGYGLLTGVTEPGGRWLQINYTTAFGDRVITSVQAYTADNRPTQSVSYSYQQFTAGSYAYTTLTGVSYSDGTSAAYTYQPSNTYPNTGPPLIETCDDVRYLGPMKKIAYEFSAQASENNGGIYGRFATARKWLYPAPFVVSYGLESHTEQRGDGPSRTFTYGPSDPTDNNNAACVQQPYLLSAYTDFKGVPIKFCYDSNGFLIGVWDRNGNSTSFTRTPLTGKPLTITHPPDATGAYSTIHFSYADPATAYYLQSVTDELQHTTVYQRDTNNRIKEIDYPDTGKETFAYNNLGEIVSHGMTSGGTETFEYDATGLRQVYRDPYHLTGKPTFWYQYDALERVSGITDSRGSDVGDINHTTNFEYNQRGQLTKTTHPMDEVTGARYSIVNTYNDDGTLRDTTDERGNSTVYGYDDYKRLASITAPLAYVGDTTPRTTLIYSAREGQVTSDYRHTSPEVGTIVTAGGRYIMTERDENFRKQTVTIGIDYESAITRYTYDPVGNLLTVVDPKEALTEYFYDKRNRLTDVNDPIAADRNSLGHTVSWTYDQAGNRKTQLRANNQLITYDQYDTMNRLQVQSTQRDTDAIDQTVMTYDPAGNLTKYVDGRQKTYNYAYDLLNRRIQVTYPPYDNGLSDSEYYHYDVANNMDTFTDRAGAIQTFEYDNRNRETHYYWSSGPQDGSHQRRLFYDEAGNLRTINRLGEDTTEIQYDGRNRKESETQTNAGRPARMVSYTYDADSNRKTITYPSGYMLTYNYNSRSQLTQESDAAGSVVTYTYDSSGNRTRRHLGNGTDTVYSVDALNRPLSIWHWRGGVRLGSFNYDYDSVGRISQVRRDPDNSGVYDYNLDKYDYYLDDQLKAAQFDAAVSDFSSAPPSNKTSLAYDADGNRMSQTNTATPSYSYAVNDLNQYTSINSAMPTYDATGNLAQYNGRTYGYNNQKLLSYFTSASSSGSFYYDGLGRQILRNEGGQWIYSVWDGSNLIEEYDINGNLIHSYVHGAATDEMVDRFDPGAIANRIWYYQDAQGSTTHLADDGGNVIETYKYDPALAGTPYVYNANRQGIASSAYGNRFLFTGREYYKEGDFYDYRNRTYLPSLGRFMQPDPIGFLGDSKNLYRYCGGDPVNRSDPLGLEGYFPGRNSVAGTGAIQPLGPQGQLFVSGVANVGIGVLTGVGVAAAGSMTYGVGAVVGVTVFGHAAVFTTTKGISQIVSSFAGTPQQQAGANAMPSNLSGAAAQMVPSDVGVALEALEAAYALSSALNAINNEGLKLASAFDFATAALDAYGVYSNASQVLNNKDPFGSVQLGLGPGNREGGGEGRDPIDLFNNGPGDFFRPGFSGLWFDEVAKGHVWLGDVQVF